jgi:hypothetical protein
MNDSELVMAHKQGTEIRNCIRFVSKLAGDSIADEDGEDESEDREKLKEIIITVREGVDRMEAVGLLSL